MGDGLVVDLFAGGGGASVGIEAALGRSVDIAINHSATALAVHAANHPGTQHLTADIWEVKPRKATGGRPVDLLWASPDCFPGGTLILTRAGLKPIEAVELGDEVLTHRARWRRVTNRSSKIAETVIVRGHGHYGIETTSNHPFYSKHVVRRPAERVNGKRNGALRTLVENPFWPKAEDMEGKLWATPRAYPEEQIPICAGAEFSDDFFYLVGRWLGDGSLNKGDVEICCGVRECDAFELRVRGSPLRSHDGEVVPYRIVDHGSSRLFVWGDAALGRWLQANFGVGSEKKRLPIWALSMQRSWRRALLEGYVDADGYEGVRLETSSVSKTLAIGIRLLAVSLGHAAALYFSEGRDGQIEGRPCIGRDSFRVAWRETPQRETVFWDSTHLFSPVREVTRGTVQTVHTIEVDEDESYVADGIVVHNCTHFSVAKGGKPRKQKIRSLAWAVVRWAREVRPRVIFLENVQEFAGWGPLTAEGKPDKERMGETFRRWRRDLERIGYVVDYRVLDASRFGAPTRRRRLFLVARCDGQSIRWPEPTHGPGLLPFHTAAECIDWSLPCPSIFERKKPLAEKTLWRIAQGIRKFVIENPRPFIVKVNHGGGDARGEPIDQPLTTVTAARRGHALVAPTLVQTGYGERVGQRPRYLDLHQPLGTVVAGGAKQALVSAFLAKHFGDPTPGKKKRSGGAVLGQQLDLPIGTVTARDHHSLAAVTLAHFRGTDPSQPGAMPVDAPLPTITSGGIHVAEVRAFLTAFYGSKGETGADLRNPMRTITTKDRLGLVTVSGVDYQIVDIGMRMLEPHELLRAQFGRFAAAYDLSAATTKAAKVRLIGNSVCPEVAEAVVAANTNATERAAA